MKIHYQNSILLILFLLLSGNINALYSAADTVITVEKAIKIALDKNPMLNSKKHEIMSMKSEKTSLISPPKPTFTYEVEGITNGLYQERKLVLEQGIEFPLKTMYRLGSMEQSILSESANLEAMERNIISKVKAAYADMAHSLQIYSLREQMLNISDSLKFIASSLLDVGYANVTDVIKSEILYEESKNALNESRINIHTSRYALLTLIGLDPDDKSYDIKFPDTLSYTEIDIKQKDVLEKVENHPVNRSYEHIVNHYGELKNAAKSDYLPDLNFTYFRQDFGTGFSYYGYSAGVSIPLWFFWGQQGKINSYSAAGEMAKWDKTKNYLDMKRDIEFAWHSYDESRKNIISIDQNIRKKSVELLRLTLIGYREGKMNLLEVLDSRTTYLQNEIMYLNKLRDYYKSIIELENFTLEDLIFN